ncbi:MAG: hypothetical protein HC927_04590, partial [Deltaproteobacteria bacterium]|nr:hypothetical protein [Deltaproteobacteria bacterium]
MLSLSACPSDDTTTSTGDDEIGTESSATDSDSSTESSGETAETSTDSSSEDPDAETDTTETDTTDTDTTDTEGGVCGNGLIEPGEVCDTGDVGGATCQSEGFASGGLT